LRAKRRKRKRLVIALAVALGVLIGAGLWLHVASARWVYSDTRKVPACRAALVLGAKVHPSGRLSVMLKDRVDAGIRLYRAGKVAKLLMTGDNRTSRYNEPQRMRDYAVAKGVPSEDVAMDFAGRRTYDSVYRARHIWGLKRYIVVSQGFHVDRAVFLARHLGIRAYGLRADRPGHVGPLVYVRELPASLLAIIDAYLRHPRPVMGKREKI
jgi:SanA protein